MKTRSVLVLYEDDTWCRGYSSCCATFPNGAISAKPNHFGFAHSSIDERLCIRCGKCVAVCAFKRIG